MAYFLENYTEEKNVYQPVLTDYTGIYETMFNFEVAWNNINESALLNEYEALTNGDEKAEESNKSGFFAKIKAWFKSLIEKIKGIIVKVKEKALSIISKSEKLLKNLAESLKGVKDKIKVPAFFNWLLPNGRKAIADCTKYVDTTAEENNKLKVNESFVITEESGDATSFASDFLKKLKDAKEKTKNKIDTASTVGDIVSKTTSLIGDIKKINNVIKKYDKVREECNKGIKACDENNKSTVDLEKKKVDGLMKTISTVINLCFTIAGNVVTVIFDIKKLNSKKQDKEEDLTKKESYLFF